MSKGSETEALQVVEVLEDLEKALSGMLKRLTAEDRHWFWLEGRRRHKAEILKVLELAAEDNRILAQLADDPAQVLNKFDLTIEEYAALASGDIRFIEEIVGELSEKQKTWLSCRLQQEKW